MTSRLKYILGGAFCGAILGAVYANYVYGISQSGGNLFSGGVILSHPASEEWEPERAASAQVQREAAETREETEDVG